MGKVPYGDQILHNYYTTLGKGDVVLGTGMDDNLGLFQLLRSAYCGKSKVSLVTEALVLHLNTQSWSRLSTQNCIQILTPK